MNIKMLKAALAGLVLSVSSFANAGLITSELVDADSLIDFSQFNSNWTFTSGPVEIGGLLGESVLWSSSNSNSVIGNNGYGLGYTSWNAGRLGYVGLNTSSGFMTFDFVDGPISEFSIFTNYAKGADYGEFVIEAFGFGDVLLETYNVTTLADINSPVVNDGAYRGVSRETNDIYSFRLYNAYVVADDLSFSRITTDVPEPSTLAIFALGIMGLVSRRSKAKIKIK